MAHDVQQCLQRDREALNPDGVVEERFRWHRHIVRDCWKARRNDAEGPVGQKHNEDDEKDADGDVDPCVRILDDQ